jgi:tight adherence protein E
MDGHSLSSSCRTQTLLRRPFRSSASGVTSVEFAVSFSVFIVVLLFLFEICRFIALASTLDLSLAEAGRLASRNKLTSTTYLELMNKHIRDKNKTFTWFFFKEASMNELTLSIKYCDGLGDVIGNRCSANSDKRIAIYNIGYRYSTLFLPLPSGVLNDIAMNNHIIYVQEHAKG